MLIIIAELWKPLW